MDGDVAGCCGSSSEDAGAGVNVPGIADKMRQEDYEKLMAELKLKGDRYFEATNHPKEGRATRHVMGERDVEGRS